MSISFQPKIIIGSVVGFIATAIGIIAVFFPSLFNLETKKIEDYKIVINNCQEADKLFNFLKLNPNKIVNFDITYYEPNLYSNIPSDNEQEFKDHFYGDFKSDWDSLTEGKGVSLFGKDKLFIVESDIKLSSQERVLARENGGIGIWCKNPKTKLPDKDEDLAYQIIIPYKTEGNTLYYWNGENIVSEGDITGREMKLKGTFLISKITHAQDYTKIDPTFVHYDYCEQKFYEFGFDNCYLPDLFILEPLSKRDIELKKY